MYFKRAVFFTACLTLIGCETLPEQSSSPGKSTSDTRHPPRTSEGIQITPYDRPEIKREPVIIPPQQKKPVQKFDDGRQVPAFKKLMQQTQTAYKAGQWAQAEQFALQAQRIAPQSAETYMYLALVANNTKQPKKADALARRGLSYAQSDAMKRQLWQIVLKAAQTNRDSNSIREAEARLKTLS